VLDVARLRLRPKRRGAAHLHPFRHPRSTKQPVDLGCNYPPDAAYQQAEAVILCLQFTRFNELFTPHCPQPGAGAGIGCPLTAVWNL